MEIFFQDTSSEEELVSWCVILWKPAIIMQIQINNWKDANFSVKIAGVNATALDETGANTSCTSYGCYIKVKDPSPLWNVPAMSVDSATGCDLHPI